MKKAAPRSTRVSLQDRFRAASDAGNLAAMLALARGEALALIRAHGLATEDELERVNALAGDFKPAGEDWFTYVRHVHAAYALGLAIGQLVHRDVFAHGGPA